MYNLQTLLHPDSDITDPHLISPHLCKKLETALITLPSVPMLRGVALEALSSAFCHLSRSTRDQSLHSLSLVSLVRSTCEVLTSLLAHSPSGWSHTLFQWGVVNLARLSCLYGTDSMEKEGVVNFMMTQPCEYHVM